MSRAGTSALTLSAEIRQRFDEFSRSQKDVGQYIVDHLDEAAFQTAEELARRASTSSSTVVRFAQALGFEGFPELQASARDEYRRVRESAPSNGGSDMLAPPLFPIDQTDFEASLAADHTNLEDTARKIDRDEVAAAVELISRAERIVLCGTDQMAFFASYLRHLLMLLDLRCEVVASPSQESLARLGRIDENTLVIGFSAGRPHPLVVRAMKLARHRKASTIAIADATLSEVAKLAGQRLLLVERTGLRALAHGPPQPDPGAGVRGVRPRRVGLCRPHQSLPAQVAGRGRARGRRKGRADGHWPDRTRSASAGVRCGSPSSRRWATGR